MQEKSLSAEVSAVVAELKTDDSENGEISGTNSTTTTNDGGAA